MKHIDIPAAISGILAITGERSVHELRMKSPYAPVVVGYCATADLSISLKELAAHCEEGSQVWFGVQARKSHLLDAIPAGCHVLPVAWVDGQMKPPASKDIDIENYDRLIFDIDGGGDIPACETVAGKVIAELGPPVARVHSGRGIHLYYRVSGGSGSLTDVKHAAECAKSMLALFAGRLNSETVKIDTAVANPARVMRLPGSINWKCEKPYRVELV